MGVELQWVWEETDPARSGSSGDIAKLFRHEDPKAPGALAAQMPPAAATLMAREVIQNSWDAARDLQRQIPNAPGFEINFKFQELTGKRKENLVRTFGLHAIAARAQELKRSSIGLQQSDCLDSLEDSTVPLRILTIKESAAAGMYGHWDNTESHMFHALVTVGFTEKKDGSGGSYGYGKAGLIAGSRIRSIAAYTAFMPVDNEPDITRRLLGMTYWGQHKAGSQRFTGFARLGQPDQSNKSVVRPFENDMADEVAQKLGFENRDIDHYEELGTTFLLIDPTVQPKDLLDAIEISWWPALVDDCFTVTVEDYNGNRLYPRPMKNEFLRTFINSWEIALGRSEAKPKKDKRVEIKYTGTRKPLGVLGLTTDATSWSYADQTESLDEGAKAIVHRSLVSLVRSPRMVVEYFPVGRTAPYVRGVFIADDSVDDLLRMTEPKAHDAWRDKSEDGDLDKDAAEAAKQILSKIQSQVYSLRAEVRPTAPKGDDFNLPLYNQLMRRLASGSGPGVSQPIQEERPLSIRLKYSQHDGPSGDIYVEGQAQFSLADNFQGDNAEVELHVDYRFLDDERLGDYVELAREVVARTPFEPLENGGSRGIIHNGESVKIKFVSENYSSDWSGKLIAGGKIISTNISDRSEE